VSARCLCHLDVRPLYSLKNGALPPRIDFVHGGAERRESGFLMHVGTTSTPRKGWDQLASRVRGPAAGPRGERFSGTFVFYDQFARSHFGQREHAAAMNGRIANYDTTHDRAVW